MKTHSVELDLSEAVVEAKSAIRGHQREDAFFRFVTLFGLLDPEKLQADAEQHIRDHPLQAIIAATHFDAAGRKTGQRPSALTDNPVEREAAITGFMEQHAQFHRFGSVHGYIAPAMRQLLSEHEIDEDFIGELVSDSALVPEDRRAFFTRALVAGFRWDFSTALHILIPQVENGLRHILKEHGVVITNFDASGVEEVWSFERVLKHEVTSEVLGKEFIFELRSLLVERLGPNLRNLLAHGLLSPTALNSEAAFYLWWVLLRLIVLPTSRMRAYTERCRQEGQPA